MENISEPWKILEHAWQVNHGKSWKMVGEPGKTLEHGGLTIEHVGKWWVDYGKHWQMVGEAWKALTMETIANFVAYEPWTISEHALLTMEQKETQWGEP